MNGQGDENQTRGKSFPSDHGSSSPAIEKQTALMPATTMTTMAAAATAAGGRGDDEQQERRAPVLPPFCCDRGGGDGEEGTPTTPPTTTTAVAGNKFESKSSTSKPVRYSLAAFSDTPAMKRHATEALEELTDEERKLYDRQIRLWGLDAQKRLNKFRVCVAGLTGLGAEVAKNVILAGVAQVTLMDHKQVSSDEFRSQFMVKPSDLDQNRASASLPYARRLNPMVKINALEEDVLTKVDDDFFGLYDMLVVCDMIPVKPLFELNDRCRKHNVKLIFGHVLSGVGFFLSDLMSFDFVGEVINHVKDGKKVKHEQMNRTYPPLRDILNVKYINKKSGAALTKRTNKVVLQLYLLLEYFSDSVESVPTRADLEKLLPKVADRLGAPEERFELDLLEEILNHEPGPVAATVGGVLGQEVVKVASQNCVPFHNSFIFDVDTCHGVVELLK